VLLVCLSRTVCDSLAHRLRFSRAPSAIVAPLAAAVEAAAASPIVVQEDEISACRWVDLDEFVQAEDHPLILAICAPPAFESTIGAGSHSGPHSAVVPSCLLSLHGLGSEVC
jgi:hypothetical protein